MSKCHLLTFSRRIPSRRRRGEPTHGLRQARPAARTLAAEPDPAHAAGLVKERAPEGKWKYRLRAAALNRSARTARWPLRPPFAPACRRPPRRRNGGDEPRTVPASGAYEGGKGGLRDEGRGRAPLPANAHRAEAATHEAMTQSATLRTSPTDRGRSRALKSGRLHRFAPRSRRPGAAHRCAAAPVRGPAPRSSTTQPPSGSPVHVSRRGSSTGSAPAVGGPNGPPRLDRRPASQSQPGMRVRARPPLTQAGHRHPARRTRAAIAPVTSAMGATATGRRAAGKSGTGAGFPRRVGLGRCGRAGRRSSAVRVPPSALPPRPKCWR